MPRGRAGRPGGRGSAQELEVAASKIHEAEATVHAKKWSRALPAANIAYDISGSGFLSGEDAEWVVERRRWLEDVHLRALECDAAASLGIGGSEVAAAERDARRLIRLAPYQESGYRLLMEELAHRGNSAQALLVYSSSGPRYETQSAPRRALPLRHCIAGYWPRPSNEELPLPRDSEHPAGQTGDARKGRRPSVSRDADLPSAKSSAAIAGVTALLLIVSMG